jgi:hypothetical protein
VGWPDFLIDLASFEWTLAKVFDGPGTEGQTLLMPEALQAFPAERFAEARLIPVPCLRLVASRYPVNAWFTAVRQGEEGEEIPIPDPASEYTAITRRDFVVRRYSLTFPQHALLAALQSGSTVAESLAAAAAVSDLDDESLAAELRSWFRLFTAEGFFSAIE